MKITNNYNSQQNFTARLFFKNTQVKDFDMLSDLKGENEMSKRGSEFTDINVFKFNSTKNVYGGFDNSADIEIKNPLLGTQKFTQQLYHETNTPIQGCGVLEYDHLDLLTGFKTNKCKDLENKALKMSLIDHITENTFKTLNPVTIFNNMVEKVPDHGFSKERLTELKNVANKLLEDMLNIASKNLKQL